MMNEILYIICLPIVVGLLLFILPEKIRMLKGLLALVTSFITFYFTIIIFSTDYQLIRLSDLLTSPSLSIFGINLIPDFIRYVTLNLDKLSKLIILFIGLIAFLISIYSLAYNSKEKRKYNYYEYFLITLGSSYGAVVSDNLILFLIFWGILGLTLYKLIPGHDEESSAAAKKSLIIIGASDGIMILGIAIIWKITHSLSMSSISLPTTNTLTITAFLALLIGSFTKAGAFPFHSWVPDYARSAPASSSAYIPASLDKLLGIYFLARITTNLFVLSDWMRLILLSLGVITIIAAVMMAIVQHNYKRLLGFHAVSQVGYMILGFGLGSMIGIAAGLFHMINNAIYKSGLLLSAGCVEYRTGKEDIDDLGGLSKAMPFTFFAAIIFALSISGIPPLNGFASKWMIYQGIIDFGGGSGLASRLWIVWLGFAILGSALTLASFIKFIGGIFLSRQKPEFKDAKDVPFQMWLPLIILAFVCIAFGVFATNYIVPKLFMPITGNFQFTGMWNSTSVSILVFVSILLGVIIYLIGNVKNFHTDDSFIGGESFQEQTSYSVLEYYKSISEFKLFSWMFKKAEEKWFDLYDLSKGFTLWLSNVLSSAHTGVLPTYSIWVFVGLIIMLLIMI